MHEEDSPRPDTTAGALIGKKTESKKTAIASLVGTAGEYSPLYHQIVPLESAPIQYQQIVRLDSHEVAMAEAQNNTPTIIYRVILGDVLPRKEFRLVPAMIQDPSPDEEIVVPVRSAAESGKGTLGKGFLILKHLQEAMVRELNEDVLRFSISPAGQVRKYDAELAEKDGTGAGRFKNLLEQRFQNVFKCFRAVIPRSVYDSVSQFHGRRRVRLWSKHLESVWGKCGVGDIMF